MGVQLADRHNPSQQAKVDEFGSQFVVLMNSDGTAVKIFRQRENLVGSSGSGSDGDTDRVYTLTTTNAVDIVEVYLDGVLLVETSQYTIDNTLKTVTLVSTAVYDTQIVSVFYNV